LREQSEKKMPKHDFKKTSLQIERDIFQLIDSVDRALDSSSGESDRKGQIVIGAFMSLFVFAAILCFEHFVGGDSRQVSPLATGGVTGATQTVVIDQRSVRFVNSQLQGIEQQVADITAVRARVAPSMPIDSQLALITKSTKDISHVLALGDAQGPNAAQDK
jgi:hypothetical protein